VESRSVRIHERRTPITLIAGHAQGLLRRPPQPAALLLIQQEAQRMGTLVTDLLDLARNDSGRLHLRRQPLQADDVLLALYERMAPQAAGRLRLQACAEAPTASGDPHRLQQCLTALVDNALLYSPAPSPVTLAASTGPAGELVLHVRDRGPGVPIEEREAIFGRFVRGSAGLASPRRGSGIGLSVVQLLIEAMGGPAAAPTSSCCCRRCLVGRGEGCGVLSIRESTDASSLVRAYY
jgi:signal transduction histidine kinase